MTQTPPPMPPPPAAMPGGKKKTLRIAIVVIITCAALSALALLVSTLLPDISDEKEQAKRVSCAANLRSIGLAISFYTDENEDAYPSDIESIVDYIGNKELLKCPFAKSNRDCDYFYSPPAKTILENTNAKTIMACDFKGNHDGAGRSVLFADKQVQWMTEEQFQQELQQTYNTAFAAALREAEGP